MALNPLVQRMLATVADNASGPDRGPRQAMQLKKQYATQVASQVAPGATANMGSWGGGVDIDRIMATIRNRESGGRYNAQNPVSSASGAYQFIDSTWGGYGGYKEAWRAPRHVQDQKAREHILGILKRYNNDLYAVPAAWYTGTYKGKGNLNYHPGGPGNPLTVQQYVDKWMRDYYG